MLIRNGIDHRMIDPMELASVLPVAGSVIRKTYYKCIAPFAFPSIQKPAQLAVHIPQCRPVCFKAVALFIFHIKIIGVMDRADLPV